MTSGRWTLSYHPKLDKDFEENIAPKDRDFLLKTIDKRLSVDPDKVGKPLGGELSGYRRIRISKYRVIYQIRAQTITVYVVTVDRRDDVYQSVFKRLGIT